MGVEILVELITYFLINFFNWLLINRYLHLTLFEADIKIGDLETKTLDFSWHPLENSIDLHWNFFKDLFDLFKLDISHGLDHHCFHLHFFFALFNNHLGHLNRSGV